MAGVQPFALTEGQIARLLSVRAAWEEGEDEERLERLRQREEDAEVLRAFAAVLDESGLAGGGEPTYAQTARLLALARALAPNPNLDARVLRRPGEPGAFCRDLRDLLFGKDAPPARLRRFLERRHAGGQTALQLLCAAFPDEWPLVTRAGLAALELTPEHGRAALAEARARYELPEEEVGQETRTLAPVRVGVPDGDPVLRLLSEVVIYGAVRDALEADDFVQAHRLLTRGLAQKAARGGRARLAPYLYGSPGQDRPARPAVAVREPEPPPYVVPAEPEPEPASPPPAPPDLASVSERDLLAYLESYVVAQGFTYPLLTVRDLYVSLQTRPFALLSGLSGTGKTRLTSLFAEALTGGVAEQYRLLPVRPDWSDSAPLLGYVNLLAGGGEGRYVATPFLDFLRRASRPENAHRAFFLCLDEMNLARVEHYGAELLSAMETAGRELLLPNGQAARLPANLFLLGTLNADEATHTLSRKVLDRANVLTFREVCLRDEADPPAALPAAPPPELRQAAFLHLRAATVAEARDKLKAVSPKRKDFAALVVEALSEANAILEPHGLHFGYRVRDEVLRYCANAFDRRGGGLLSPDAPGDRDANLRTALDLQLVQKVLPRFTGAAEQVGEPLRVLRAWADKRKFARVALALSRLASRLDRDGFVTFDAP